MPPDAASYQSITKLVPVTEAVNVKVAPLQYSSLLPVGAVIIGQSQSGASTGNVSVQVLGAVPSVTVNVMSRSLVMPLSVQTLLPWCTGVPKVLVTVPPLTVTDTDQLVRSAEHSGLVPPVMAIVGCGMIVNTQLPVEFVNVVLQVPSCA